MNKIISIYGAFDRFNYGDLLFPIVIRNFLNEHFENLEYRFYGIAESDLSEFGAVQTMPIRRRFDNALLAGQKEIFIIAGGEVLFANWFFLYQSLNYHLFRAKIFNKLHKLLGAPVLNYVCNKLLCPKLEIPFVIDQSFLSGCNAIIYNTVGGSKFKNYNSEKLLKSLYQAKYISVRDKNTQKNITKENQNVQPLLFPDSVTIVSKYYPYNILTKMIGSETEKIIKNNKKGYICFQVSSGWFFNNKDIIIKELKLLSKDACLPIVLLPIGRAPFHSDNVALEYIYKELMTQSILPEKQSIYDIMALIANASLFIGTSLHGNITAMSFAIPFLPLNPSIFKLKSYIDTWCNADTFLMANFNEIHQKAIQALKIDKNVLISLKNHLIKLSEDNISNITKCIRLNL